MLCLVFLWKKGSGDMGHEAFGPPPVGGPAPSYPPYKNKNGKKSAIFGFLYFLPPHPHPTTPPPPHPHPNKNNLGQPLERGLCTLENSWDLAMDFDSR